MRLPTLGITRSILNLIILIFSLELLLLGFLVYRQQSLVGKLSKEKAEKEGEIERYATLYREIPQLEESLSTLKTQLEAVEWNLPSLAYIPTFLGQIEEWARQCGVKLTNISPQQAPTPSSPARKAEEEVGIKRGEYREQAKPQETTKPSSPFETIPLNLQIEGNFYAIQRFIDGFRTFPKVLSLTKMDITPQEREGGAPLLRVSLYLNIAVLSGGGGK